MFESGAIVLHIGERSETLLPRDPAAKARATEWLIAALNSVEPHIQNLAAIDLFYAAGGMGEAAPARRRGDGAQPPRRGAHARSATGHGWPTTASPPAT